MFEPYALTKKVSMKNDMLASKYYTQPELELTLAQKKLLMLLVSKIEKDDTTFKSESFLISDYCKLFNINYDGSNRQMIRQTLVDIGKKCFILPVDEKGHRERLFRWVDDIQIDYKEGIIQIKLAESLRPYYLEIKNNFVAYQLGYTTSFRSKYSYTLYELCKSKSGMKQFYISIEDAQLQLAYNKYKTYTDLIRFVIKPAIAEINKYTDINVSFEPYKEGKRVAKLLFHISKKTGKSLAEVDKWKAQICENKRITATMKDVFRNEIEDENEREAFSDYEEEQYNKLMERYTKEKF